jgi:prevent-host-death family protein
LYLPGEVTMQTVSIRDLMHNFSHYLKEVKSGEGITVLKRNVPVADIVPHENAIRFPGWKRTVNRRKIKGEAFSKTVMKSREDQ